MTTISTFRRLLLPLPLISLSTLLVMTALAEPPTLPPGDRANGVTDAVKKILPLPFPGIRRSSETTEHPVVIRIAESALSPADDKPVDKRAAVDTMVLGTHAVGQSHTTGTVRAHTVTDRNDATFVVSFQGRTETRTTGYNGPAIIYSHTITDFVCTRPVTFDPRLGFLAGTSKINSKTTLIYEGFGSSRGRLGSRLIARVASRRAAEQHAQAEQIAARDNQQQICQQFDERLNVQLAGLNQRMRTARFVKALFGDSTQLKLAAASSSYNCIHLGIGVEGCSPQLSVLPPKHVPAAPLEIWIHPTLFGENVASAVKLASAVKATTGVFDATSRLALLSALAGGEQEAEGLEIAVADGWIVIGLPREQQTKTATKVRAKNPTQSTLATKP